MGGTAGQLSNGLWQARGDEFSVEKADFGYLVRTSGTLDSGWKPAAHDWQFFIDGTNPARSPKAPKHSIRTPDASSFACAFKLRQSWREKTNMGKSMTQTEHGQNNKTHC